MNHDINHLFIGNHGFHERLVLDKSKQFINEMKIEFRFNLQV